MSKFIPNSFQVPNALVDELMAKMSGAELKCYLAIVRKTKGWGKDEDAISITQLMELTGLSNRKVIDCCNSLVKCGLLTQKTGVRGVKILSINQCKNFTSEENSPVKKVHGKYEESSLVTSEESSHTKNNIKNTTKKQRIYTHLSVTNEQDEMIQFGIENQVDESLVKEFIDYRKSVVKSKLTLRGLRMLANEAKKAKMSLTSVLETVMENSWKGFRASWDLGKNKSESTIDIDYQAVIDAYNEILGDRLVPITELDDLAIKQIDTLMTVIEKKTVEAFRAYFYAFANNAQSFYFDPERKLGFSFLMKPETLIKTRRGEI